MCKTHRKSTVPTGDLLRVRVRVRVDTLYWLILGSCATRFPKRDTINLAQFARYYNVSTTQPAL